MARIIPTNESSQTLTLPTPTFPQFPLLPREIQFKIWQHAIPDPRSILGVVRLLLDFDLSKPRAILPSIREFKAAYRTMHFPFTDEGGELDDEFYESKEAAIWRPSNADMATSRREVLNLMHACRMARLATLERYRLAVGSEIEEENKPWWDPEDDMVLFIGPDHRERSTILHWLFSSRDEPLPVFETLQHVAVTCDFTLHGYLVSPFYSDVVHLEEDSLDNLPELQSFTMFIDPASVLERSWGKVLLYEALQKPVQLFRGLMPREIERAVTGGFKEVLPEDMELPLVEVFVAGWDKR
ncbi:hypothetical protein ONS95_005838 [Cadophora gregata]|uniref:uncharacterized protein n=1 Tax=Cadophora gregata TaxID=51156 RepID=UPI0026DD0ED4|nr:uncharacterized protein ONS95_005838 [Cadophora gregata]KAK0102213.1 hypothetical protein ONS95_005838 [Cadophora gregata]KAK0103841.1 hypothetical protein ONS96_004951 [Cadophora gregata f. sp. sojae]